MILIGTSGYSYADWRGHFYPAGLPAAGMLAHYARHFPACEINATYYKILDARQTQAMVAKSGGRVTFVVKAHGSMTHERTAGETEYRAFASMLAPFREAGRLGAILAQFPYSFANNADNRGYLADFRAQCPEGHVVVEFRHRSWHQESVLDFLRQLEFGIVNVDEPELKNLMPASETVTGPVGYVRFHGRNKEKWFQSGGQPWERYDYLYSADELTDWVPRIRRMDEKAATTFVFFNNHWQSQAVTNARQMGELLGLELPNPGSE